MKLWNVFCSLDNDPHPGVAALSLTVTNYIKNQVKEIVPKEALEMKMTSSLSLPPSPSNRSSYLR